MREFNWGDPLPLPRRLGDDRRPAAGAGAVGRTRRGGRAGRARASERRVAAGRRSDAVLAVAGCCPRDEGRRLPGLGAGAGIPGVRVLRGRHGAPAVAGELGVGRRELAAVDAGAAHGAGPVPGGEGGGVDVRGRRELLPVRLPPVRRLAGQVVEPVELRTGSAACVARILRHGDPGAGAGARRARGHSCSRNLPRSVSLMSSQVISLAIRQFSFLFHLGFASLSKS
jgi:hypothetical protein